jgi:hypothetical protein
MRWSMILDSPLAKGNIDNTTQPVKSSGLLSMLLKIERRVRVGLEQIGHRTLRT